MDIDLILASGHHLAVFMLVAILAAEFALLVRRDCGRLGLGRLLLGALVDHARRRGIGRVWGVVLAENRPMLELARAMGFRRQLDPDDASCRRVELLLAENNP